jgi:hypothetical protein
LMHIKADSTQCQILFVAFWHEVLITSSGGCEGYEGCWREPAQSSLRS